MNKKIIFGLGTMVAVSLPIVSVISCNDETSTEPSRPKVFADIPGADVYTTNIDGVHFEVKDGQAYLYIDGTKVTPEVYAAISYEDLKNSVQGRNINEFRSVLLNVEPFVRFPGVPDSSIYVNSQIPRISENNFEQGPSQSQEGIRTLQGYNGPAPLYNVYGKLYTTEEEMLKEQQVDRDFIARQNDRPIDAVAGVPSIRDIHSINQDLELSSQPESINVDGVAYSKFSFAETTTPITSPGYFLKNTQLTDVNASPEQLGTANKLYEVDGVFYQTYGEAALHLGFWPIDDTTNLPPVGTQSVNFPRDNGRGVSSQGSEFYGWDYYSIEEVEGQPGTRYAAAGEGEEFEGIFPNGKRIVSHDIDADFIQSHKTLDVCQVSRLNNVTTETHEIYSYKTTLDGVAVINGFYNVSPTTTSTPLDLSTIIWELNGNYYTSDAEVMENNEYRSVDIIHLVGQYSQTEFYDDEEKQRLHFGGTLDEFVSHKQIGDVIYIDGQSYTVA